jgi:hypothetical protein
MSSRPPHGLSSRRAHPRRSHPRPTRRPSSRLPAITPAAFRPRRHIGDPSAILAAPSQTAPLFPAVSSLRGFRTPAPASRTTVRKGRRPKPFSIAAVQDRVRGRLDWADCGPTSSPRGTTGVGPKGVNPSRALSRLDRRKQALVEAAAERPQVKSGPSQAAACRSIAILRDGAGLCPHGRVNAGLFFLWCGTAARCDWGLVDAPYVVPYGPRAKVQGRNRGWNDARF